MPRKVYLIAAGLISPVGETLTESWQRLTGPAELSRAVQWIETKEDQIRVPCCAARAPLPVNQASETQSRSVQLVMAALQDALASMNRSGGEDRPVLSPETAICVGTSKPDLSLLNGRIDPASLMGWLDPAAPARAVAAACRLDGGLHVPVAACATGVSAVIRAAQLIADGQHDVVISGATDASIMPLWIAAYRQMGILADPHPRYGAEFACQPFDRDRRGFAVGEGAAILILASRAGAQRLHARPWAEISGWSSGTDPAGLTRATEDATPLANVLGKTLARADRCPDQLVAVHAHGTATALNDTGETRALRLVLGDSALESVPLISLKGAIGHLMGAAGAVEVALAAQSAIHGRSPGNTTLMHPDPELGRLCLPRESWGHSPGPVLKVSQGFGGQLAAVIIEPVR